MATTRVKIAILASLIVAPAGLSPHRLSAQEPTGLQAAAAIEGAFVDAIAHSEKSVVAIARVDADDSALRTATVELGPGGGLPHVQAPRSPSDPDFVPDAYATGVVVDRRGLILTYYHVLRLKSQHYVTTPDRRVYAAKIKAADPRSDLAILEIEADNLTPIKFGDASLLKKGQIAIALGNPYAIARDGEASASWGIISNLARKAAPEQPSESGSSGKVKLYHFGTLIQTDAKLNLGTSGGALVNLHGEMIGLTTSLAATAGSEQAAGYAVPVDETFRRVVDTLKEGREVDYGYLGVRLENLKDSEILQGAHGARVVFVQQGAPADRFGLRAADVVTYVNDQSVFDADGLMLQVGRLPVESKVQLTVERDGRERKMQVELQKFPVRGVKVVSVPSPAWRGLRVDYPTALLAPDAQRVPYDRLSPDGCVVVTEVEKDSPAAAAELQVGMFITQVGGSAVHTPREFHAAVAGKSDDVPMRIVPGAEANATELRTVKPKAG